MSRVLLAYETKHGSTLHTAGEMAELIRWSKHRAEVRRAREVTDLDGYHAVILGAPIYDGRWNEDAARFVERHRGALATMPFRVFALHPLTADDVNERVGEAERLRAALQEAGCPPNASVEVFGGFTSGSELHVPFGRSEPGDWRPWRDIDAWVGNLIEELGRTS